MTPKEVLMDIDIFKKEILTNELPQASQKTILPCEK